MSFLKVESMRLTKPQLLELKALGRGPQNTYGRSRTRVQNMATLIKLGLARYLMFGQCVITDAGRAELAARAFDSRTVLGRSQ